MKKINKKEPLVSVIMPVYNAGMFLSLALDSIRSQTHTNWELIAINDASTDKTLQTLKRYQKVDQRIKILSNVTKQGIGYSLNKGIIAAKGEYIARMDADDISLPTRFAKQLALLQSKKHLVACGGQAAMIDPRGKIFAYKRFPTNPQVLYEMIMRMVPMQHPILMARASIFTKYRYLEHLKTAEDMDMLFYLLSCGPISNVDSVIYQYRKTDMSNGYHNVKQTFYLTFAARFEAIKKYDYHPTLTGILVSFAQLGVVSLLPSKLVVRVFEAMRFNPPLWQIPWVITHVFAEKVKKARKELFPPAYTLSPAQR